MWLTLVCGKKTIKTKRTATLGASKQRKRGRWSTWAEGWGAGWCWGRVGGADVLHLATVSRATARGTYSKKNDHCPRAWPTFCLPLIHWTASKNSLIPLPHFSWPLRQVMHALHTFLPTIMWGAGPHTAHVQVRLERTPGSRVNPHGTHVTWAEWLFLLAGQGWCGFVEKDFPVRQDRWKIRWADKNIDSSVITATASFKHKNNEVQ